MSKYAFHADESYYEDGCYLVIKVERDEPGYTIVERQPAIDQTRARAKILNHEHDVSEDERMDILASSMRASRASRP